MGVWWHALTFVTHERAKMSHKPVRNVTQAGPKCHTRAKMSHSRVIIHNNAFSTWIGNVCELLRTYNLDISLTVNEFKNECKRVVCESFKNDWYRSLMNLIPNPSLRTYVSFKFSFKQEPYLHVIKEQKCRIALSRLRASLHTLEIERGRHDRPKKPVDARLCSSCSVIEDDILYASAQSIGK